MDQATEGWTISGEYVKQPTEETTDKGTSDEKARWKGIVGLDPNARAPTNDP